MDKYFKRLETQRLYYEQHKEQIKQYYKKYYQDINHVIRRREITKRWIENNRVQFNENQKLYARKKREEKQGFKGMIYNKADIN